MNSTSSSLLERLRHPNAEEAWDRFVRLYSPLLFHWARGVGLRRQDAADLVQEVLVLLVRKMPTFQYDRSRSFRAWPAHRHAQQVARAAARAAPAVEGDAALQEVAAPEGMAVFEEAEYRRYVVRRALDMVRPGFPDRAWQAFWRYAVEGADPAAVAAALGLSVGSVYAAKSRVMARLREELEGLLD